MKPITTPFACLAQALQSSWNKWRGDVSQHLQAWRRLVLALSTNMALIFGGSTVKTLLFNVFLMTSTPQNENFTIGLSFPMITFAKNPTLILQSCSSWQRLTSQLIFDWAMTCDVVSSKDWKSCGQAVFKQVCRFGREHCDVLSCCYSAEIVLWSSRWCAVMPLDVSAVRTKVAMWRSALAFSLADHRCAAIPEVAISWLAER